MIGKTFLIAAFVALAIAAVAVAQSAPATDGGFDNEIITSENAGVNKPHSDIFRHAVNITSANPANSLMIGDHWDADIRGAAVFGMDQVWYNPERKPVPKPPPTYAINELKELLNFL